MIPMQWQLERFGDTATLYVSGTLDRDGLTTLLDVCAALPPHVRTLRLDLQALGTMSADSLSAVRVLLHHWRDTRHGEFRLSTEYLVATCSETAAISGDARPRLHEPRLGEARRMRFVAESEEAAEAHDERAQGAASTGGRVSVHQQDAVTRYPTPTAGGCAGAR